MRVNNLVTTNAGKAYDRDYVIDYLKEFLQLAYMCLRTLLRPPCH